MGEEVKVEDGGCKVNIAPFDGWGRKGSTWAIGVGIRRVFAEPIPIRCSVWGLPWKISPNKAAVFKYGHYYGGFCPPPTYFQRQLILVVVLAWWLPWPPWCSYGDLELKLSADYCDSFRQPSGKYIHSSSSPNFPTHTGPRWPRMCALCLPRISLFSEIHSPAHHLPQQQRDCNAFLKMSSLGIFSVKNISSKISVSTLSSIWRDEDVGACNWPKEEQEV